MTKKALRAFLLVIAIAGLALRTLFLINTPIDRPETVGSLSSYGDERAHVEYTLHILKSGSLPCSASAITSASDIPTFENYQSPLYYVIHAGACSALGIDDVRGVTLCGRALSLLAGVLLTFVAWKSFFLLGGASRSIEWATLFAFFALAGVFVRFAALSSNDAFFWLCVGLCCYYLLRLPSDPSVRTIAFLFFWIVVAFYVKISALLLVPAVAFQLVRARVSLHRLLPLACAAIVLLFPLFLRNLRDFGSVLPLSSGFGEAAWRMPTFSDVLYSIRSSMFPWSEVWNNWLGLALMLPALLIMFVMLVKWLRVPELSWYHVLLGSTLIAFVFLNLRYDQAEARYLFVAWPVMLPIVLKSGFRARSFPYIAAVSFCLPYALFLA